VEKTRHLLSCKSSPQDLHDPDILAGPHLLWYFSISLETTGPSLESVKEVDGVARENLTKEQSIVTMSDKIQAPYPAQSTLIATAICVTRCDINFQRCRQTVHTEQHQKKIKRKIWVIALAFIYHYIRKTCILLFKKILLFLTF